MPVRRLALAKMRTPLDNGIRIEVTDETQPNACHNAPPTVRAVHFVTTRLGNIHKHAFE